MWKFVKFLVLVVAAAVDSIDNRIFDTTGLPAHTVMIKAGQNQTIYCPGVNEQSLILALEWYVVKRKAKIVEYAGDVTTVWADQRRISLKTNSYGLSFHPAVGDDSGEYVCLVNNRPKPEAVVRFIVQDVPGPPGRPLIVSFTSRSVNLSWAPPLSNHNSPIKYYIIHTRVGEAGEWNTKGIITRGNTTKYQVTRLHPYTVYSFRVVAVNEMGPSPPSKESYYMVTLREAPTGKPVITAAHNTSSSMIHISWRPPHHDTIHGEFLGYRIAYRPRDRGDEAFQELYIRDPKVESHTIQDLETYTQYLVSLQVFNPEGPGPNTTVLVMTDEGVPEKPRNLTALDVSPNALSLGWLPPRKANGAIEGYQIYFMFGNYTDVATYRYQGNPDLLKFKLNNLKPSTQYKIWVKAFTRKNVGDPSDPLITMTDIAGPGAPKILNATCKTQESIAVQWARPEKIEHSLDYYYLKVDAGDALYSNITLPASKEHLETTYVIENVTSNTIYDIAVQAGTKSPRTGKVVTGPFSEPVSINVKINCDKSEEFLKRATSELSAGMVAGVICAGFAFLLALTAFVVWRKCFRTAYYYLDDPPCNVPTVSLDWNAPPPACRGDHKGAIPVNLFSRHVAELHADGDIGFSREYESIQLETASEGHTSEHSQQPENRAKNRYLNIIAYDHSRVHLLSMNGQRRGIDYINANYIDGFQWSRAYIGTQGPLPSTFDCFWRMVWEQRVNIIVMITNLVERGRRKCDMYWPKEGTETYGVIQVKLVKEDIMATYTVRTLQIRHLRPNLQIKKKKPALTEKLVYQYHYTSWPDHGTPDHPLPVLEFIKKSAAANPSDSGPIIVHCSAGVGRTGTYIVIDAMLRQIKYRNEVNIYGFLLHIRSQRNFLVQTEEQYIFIHDAILEAIEAGDTSIPRETFPKYVRMLQGDTSEEKNEKWKSLEAQYKQVLNFVMKEKEANASHKAINKPKNRTLDLVPVDNYRVHLTPKPGEDGSDYINASWIQGFCNLREFIITQHPMKSTINDFWQMVWDHSAQTIVMISIIDNQDFEVFWPVENECVEVDAFRVKLVNEQMFTSYMVLHFVMQSLQDDYELNVKMIQCPNWPHHNAITELYHLPNSVQNLVNIQNGPIIVVDRYGGTEAATFCALTSIKKHMHYDAHIDVYMYAKVYHIRRPGVWMNTNDYLNLHLAVQSLCNPPEDVPDTFNMPNGGANGSVSNECVRMPPEGMEAVGPRLTA